MPALRALRDKERQYRDFFEYAAVGMYMCHKEDGYTACNRAYARLLGYAGPDELLRMVRNVGEQVYVDPGRHEELLAELEKGQALGDKESWVYGRDGDMIRVSEHLTPRFDENGSFVAYDAVVSNITDKRQAEEEITLANSLLRNTIDGLNAFVAVTDLDGYLIITNKTFEQELGELVGARRKLEFVAGENSLFSLFLEEVEQNPEMEFEFRGQCLLTGSDDLMDTRITRYLTPDGKVAGAVFVMRPVGA